MELLQKLWDGLTGQAGFTMADPGFDPMNESVRKSRRSLFGCMFWIVLAGVVGSVVFAMQGYRQNKIQEQERQAQSVIATSVYETESAFTPTKTITSIPTLTTTPDPTETKTPTITTTPATLTPTPTPSLTPQPQIIYQDRTIVITVEVPWVITHVVKETVIVVVTATPTETPTTTPTETPTPTPTETPTP